MDELIRRILRVDHAGEHGAVAIDSAQLQHARRKFPDLVPWLEQTLSHEIRHRERFKAAMDERAVTPCGALTIWSVGGRVLGATTAAFGRPGVYICTAAVERTVRRHLVEQAEHLDATDPRSRPWCEKFWSKKMSTSLMPSTDIPKPDSRPAR